MKNLIKFTKKFLLPATFLVGLLVIASFVYANAPTGGFGGGGGGGGGGVTTPPTAYLYINSSTPSPRNAGQSVTLNWSSTNAASCSGLPGMSNATSGSVTIGPLLDDTSYIVTCENAVGIANDSVSVVVLPIISDFYPTNKSVNYGAGTDLNWVVTGAAWCNIIDVNGNTLYKIPSSDLRSNKHKINSITKATIYLLKCSTTPLTVTPPASTSTPSCHGKVVGSVGSDGSIPGPYEGQSCSQFITETSCLQGWPTHGCSWY